MPNILVVRFGALGDVVLTTPLLRAVHRAVPDAAVTVVTKAAWADVLAGHPAVQTVEPLAPPASVRELARRLRGTTWDARLDLHGSLRSRTLRLLVGGRWHGWRKPRLRRAMRVWGGVIGPALAPMAEQYFAAARHLGVTSDGQPPDVHPTSDHEARAAATAPAGRFVALVPGAAHPTKRWPPGHWRALAATLRARGVTAVAVGMPDERALIAGADVVDACGIGLGPTAALLRRAAVAVAGDTGLMHLATAVGTPVVALYGPTTPDLGYAPHGPGTVVQRDIACRPCSVFGGRHCPMRHHRCMIEITPEQVADAVESRLA